MLKRICSNLLLLSCLHGCATSAPVENTAPAGPAPRLDPFHEGLARALVLSRNDRPCEAARVFDSLAARTTVEIGARREVAYEAVRAWQRCTLARDDLWPSEIAATDAYLALVPDGDDATHVRFTRGQLRFQHDDCEGALPDLSAAIDADPDGEVVPFAAALRFDCLNRLGRVDELATAVQHDCALAALRTDASVAELCRSLLVQVERKRLEQLERDGRFREAADGYLRAAEAHGDEPRVAELLYNAAVLYDRAADRDAADRARRRLIELRPDDVLAGRARQQLAH